MLGFLELLRECSFLSVVLRDCKDKHFSITNLQVTGIYDGEQPVYSAMISLRSRKFTEAADILPHIAETEGVRSVDSVTV